MIQNFQLIKNFLPNNYKTSYYKLIFLSFVISILELFSIALVIPLVQFLFSDLSDTKVLLRVLSNYSILIDKNVIFVTFIGVYLSKILITYFNNVYRETFIYSLNKDIASKLLKLYLSQPISFFKEKNSSELIKNINSEAWQACGGAVKSFVVFISEIMLLLVLTIFLLNLYFSLTIFFLILVLSLSYFFFKFYKKKIRSYSENRVYAEESVLRNFIESIGAIKEIKIFQKFNFFISNFINSKNYENEIRKKIEILATLPRLYYETILVLLLFLFYLSTIYVNLNLTDISYILTAFIAVSIRLIPSFSKINGNLQNFQMYKISIEIVQKDFSNLNQQYLEQINILPINFHKKILINNINFSFNNKKIIKNFSYEIEKGDYIGIYGESGTGKTTLVNLISGLEKPDNGDIICDEQKINNNILGWYKNFGIVHQSNFFLNDTIKNNIILDKNTNDSDQNQKVIKLLKDLNLNKFIEKIDYLVGERGSKLSLGEQQRVALARAFYKDISILILDEATSNLDKENEDIILSKIKAKNEEGLTVLHISHDLKSLRHSNKILKFTNQEIVKSQNF